MKQEEPRDITNLVSVTMLFAAVMFFIGTRFM